MTSTQDLVAARHIELICLGTGSMARSLNVVAGGALLLVTTFSDVVPGVSPESKRSYQESAARVARTSLPVALNDAWHAAGTSNVPQLVDYDHASGKWRIAKLGA
ncbi:hypothetical protein ACQCSX_17565 [Pseudarthrobacter sp. P1]|uniref:hypothetical protein n=1 Tax=Pseudarthrobacter sp. P1 TaxID=3418418 RepID=UPI003CF7456E